MYCFCTAMKGWTLSLNDLVFSIKFILIENFKKITQIKKNIYTFTDSKMYYPPPPKKKNKNKKPNKTKPQKQKEKQNTKQNKNKYYKHGRTVNQQSITLNNTCIILQFPTDPCSFKHLFNQLNKYKIYNTPMCVFLKTADLGVKKRKYTQYKRLNILNIIFN